MLAARGLEVANALVLTYLATEYLLKEQIRHSSSERLAASGFQKRLQRASFLVWGLVNFGFFLARLFSSSEGGDRSASSFHLHLPSQVVLVFVFVSFVALAWWDIRRVKPDLTTKTFVRQICVSTLESLLILPLVSVGVAMAFLVLIGILDTVHTSTVWLNNPIYYGVLYGPFSTIYFFTKKRCVSNRGQILPL